MNAGAHGHSLEEVLERIEVFELDGGRSRDVAAVFKNPPGDHAARLIEAVGGKGLAVGGARVSAKHANFIVAGPGATAGDVHGLMAALRDRVRARFGVDLEPEVHLVGTVA
jgi:UDP-N-acetylmuramate dehydrogenase